MFAVYATHAAPDDPLLALKIGERPEPEVPAGWVRVKITHASLNRHDLFTLRGMSGHPEGRPQVEAALQVLRALEAVDLGTIEPTTHYRTV